MLWQPSVVTSDPYPDSTHEVCMRADAVLFAAVGDLKYDNDPTAKIRPETGLLAMRKKLGLYANVRPVVTFDCLLHKSPLKDEIIRGADFVVLQMTHTLEIFFQNTQHQQQS